jgi:hypothetical protein
MSGADFDWRAFGAGVRSDRGVECCLRKYALADQQNEQDGENWNSGAHGGRFFIGFRVSVASDGRL